MIRIVSLTLIASLASLPGIATPAAATEEPRASMKSVGPGYRFEKDGWIYVHLEGSPEQIGFQHGALLSNEIADLLRVIKPFLANSAKRDWKFFRDASEKMLWQGIDAEYRAEIDGIVAGLESVGKKADRWDLVALNANQELPFYTTFPGWTSKMGRSRPRTHPAIAALLSPPAALPGTDAL